MIRRFPDAIVCKKESRCQEVKMSRFHEVNPEPGAQTFLKIALIFLNSLHLDFFTS